MNDIKTPKNDNTCGWSEIIASTDPCAQVVGDIKTDWLVVGAGYTGLSAARTLALLHPNKRIVLIDGQKAGEGASARNSGYLVDSTLNDGHLSDTGLSTYQQKYQLNKAGLEATKALVEEHKIQCDWSEIGKIHATASIQNEQKLQRFSETLDQLNLEHNVLSGMSLKNRLGTSYYRLGIETKGAVMLQPASLAMGLIDILPENVTLFEHSPMLEWKSTNINGCKTYQVNCPSGTIITNGLIFAVNGFMPSIGLKRDRVFPLTLTASLTRRLSDAEYQSIGQAPQWGLLSAHAMGATVRLTKDRRLMIRNTAEVWRPMSMSPTNLKQRKMTHIAGLRKRFPLLGTDAIKYTWSGITCVSKNNANVFGQVDNNAFAAGCYNGGGIGLGILYGQQIALYASGGSDDTTKLIQNRPTPKRLPPQPFLNWGVALRLKKDRYFAKTER